MTLEEFALRWMSAPPRDSHPITCDEVAGMTGHTLHQDGPFQVQLWTCPPGSEVSDHTHPDIDGFAVHVSGEIFFRKHGHRVTHRDMKIVSLHGYRTLMVHLGPNDPHGVSFGPYGGSFLSITERLDGREPSSVHLNWSGPPLDDAHAFALKEAT